MNSTPLLERSFTDAVGTNSLLSLVIGTVLLVFGWWFVLHRRVTILGHLVPVAILIFTFLFVPGPRFMWWTPLLISSVLCGIILLFKAWRIRFVGQSRAVSTEPWSSVLTVMILAAVLVLSFEVLRTAANLIAAAVSPQ